MQRMKTVFYLFFCVKELLLGQVLCVTQPLASGDDGDLKNNNNKNDKIAHTVREKEKRDSLKTCSIQTAAQERSWGNSSEACQRGITPTT